MLLSGDPTIFEIALRSLRVTLTALAVSLVVGVPFGMALALNRFPLRRLVVTGVNTGMGAPPVVVGLVVAIILLWWLFGRSKADDLAPPVIEPAKPAKPVSYTHLRAHETVLDLVCRLLLEKKKTTITKL